MPAGWNPRPYRQGRPGDPQHLSTKSLGGIVMPTASFDPLPFVLALKNLALKQHWLPFDYQSKKGLSAYCPTP